MMLYYYNQEWIVASSGLPDASGKVRDQNYNLKELFWRLWSEEGYKMPKDPSSCYFFEMVDPSIKVLVPYEKGGITLIGARNLETLKEYSISRVSNEEWRRVQQYPIQSMEDILEISRGLNPIQQEGFVVCDDSFNRIKVKSPQYVKINLLSGANEKLTDRYLLEIIQANEGEEFLAYFEDYRRRYNELKRRYNQLITDLEALYEEVKTIEDRRELGLKVKASAMPSLFFQLKDGKVSSIKEYIRNLDGKRLINNLK